MKLYMSRINGYALLTFWIGIGLNYAPRNIYEIAIIIGTAITLAWQFNHDMLSFERSEMNEKS